jgi:hypothetical protein
LYQSENPELFRMNWFRSGTSSRIIRDESKTFSVPHDQTQSPDRFFQSSRGSRSMVLKPWEWFR